MSAARLRDAPRMRADLPMMLLASHAMRAVYMPFVIFHFAYMRKDAADARRQAARRSAPMRHAAAARVMPRDARGAISCKDVAMIYCSRHFHAR